MFEPAAIALHEHARAMLVCLFKELFVKFRDFLIVALLDASCVNLRQVALEMLLFAFATIHSIPTTTALVGPEIGEDSRQRYAAGAREPHMG